MERGTVSERSNRYALHVSYQGQDFAEMHGLDSRLLVLRVWREAIGPNQFEWRAQVRDGPSGEVRYIRSWPDLVKFLNDLEETEKPQ